jgi:heme exporter protein A
MTSDVDDLPALQAQGLACRRGGRVLYRDLDLNIHPGQLVWLRGPNGSGKSTLLSQLAGLGEPDAGVIRFGDESVRRLSAPRRARLRYIAHRNALSADLRVVDAVRFLCALHGEPHSAREVEAALAYFELEASARRRVGTLSQGQRRKVALTRLMLSRRPQAWLVDEPFDALDAHGGAQLGGLLQACVALGSSVVVTSHVPLQLPQAREVHLFPDAA